MYLGKACHLSKIAHGHTLVLNFKCWHYPKVFLIRLIWFFISIGTAASNTLLWRELRRQRELQEQKLKKRKERLLLERKGRRAGLENASEDEGFGRSTLSADITTATWGGSTQMSSTQNDSAVSEGSSHDSDEEVGV